MGQRSSPAGHGSTGWQGRPREAPDHRPNLGLERSRWKGQPSGLPADCWSSPGREDVAVPLLERQGVLWAIKADPVSHGRHLVAPGDPEAFGVVEDFLIGEPLLGP